ncbi:hypothetical protein GCM10023083_23020 [Streptomyces phyllanthi]
MSASKVRATVLSRVLRGPFSKTGVRPAGPGAMVGGREDPGREDPGGEGRATAREVSVEVPHPVVRAVPRRPSAQREPSRRTKVIIE